MLRRFKGIRYFHRGHLILELGYKLVEMIQLQKTISKRQAYLVGQREIIQEEIDR